MVHTIGIVELYQHNEVLFHFCKLFALGNSNVKIFCSKEIYNDVPKEYLKNPQFKWFPNQVEINNFLKANKKELASCDCILVTTIFSHFNAFKAISSLSKTALIVHSYNTWFEPFKHISIRKNNIIRDVYRLVRFIIHRQATKRKSILNHFDIIGFPNKSILDYALSKTKGINKNKLRSIPFGGHIGRSTIPKMLPIRFTITGTVENNVRDYHLVFEAVKLLKGKLLKPIELVLLGRPNGYSGKKIIDQFKSLKIQNMNIISFDNYISVENYQTTLLSSNVLILPIKPDIQFIAFREYSFQSKLSGSVNDLIKHGIPALVSSSFAVDKEIDAQVYSFSDARMLSNHMLELALKFPALDDNLYAEHTYPRLLIELKKTLGFE